jgi:hypothetical protein
MVALRLLAMHLNTTRGKEMTLYLSHYMRVLKQNMAFTLRRLKFIRLGTRLRIDRDSLTGHQLKNSWLQMSLNRLNLWKLAFKKLKWLFLGMFLIMDQML